MCVYIGKTLPIRSLLAGTLHLFCSKSGCSIGNTISGVLFYHSCQHMSSVRHHSVVFSYGRHHMWTDIQ